MAYEITYDNKIRAIVDWKFKDAVEKINAPYMLSTTGLQVTLPNCMDSYLFLLNCGIKDILKNLPSYNHKFLIEGRFEPMQHQRATAAFMTIHKRCYVLSDCRLGKTGSAIMAIDWLQNNGYVNGAALIITTLTTVKSVWLDSISKSCPSKSATIIHGKKDLHLLKENYNFFVTNYDTIRLWVDAFLRAVGSRTINYILVDELTHCGNMSAARTKAIAKLINSTGVPFACGMTGTPGSNPEPIFGMCRTINPKGFGYTAKYAWLNATTVPFGIYPNQRKIKPEAAELIFKGMQPAIRYKKEDVLDLPPIVKSVRACNLLTTQVKAIEDIWDKAIVEFSDGTKVSAANSAVKLMRILQIALGFTPESYCIPYPDLDDPRSKTILDVITETDKKVVIFSMFRKRLEMLAQLMKRNKISYAVIHGDITGLKRSEILSAFTNEIDPRILIAHPTTVGYGVELSVADTLVIDGPLLLGNFSYNQAIERLSSIKQQSNKISIIKISGDRREEKVFEQLEKGYRASQIVSQLFTEASYGFF